MGETSQSTIAPRAGVKIGVDTWFAVSVVVGTTCAGLAGLGYEPPLPRVPEFAGWLGFFGGLIVRLAPAPTPHRPGVARVAPAVAGLLGLHAWLSFRLPCWLGDESTAEAVSRTARVLSSTFMGLPLAGLGYAWGVCLVAWLAGGSARRACALAHASDRTSRLLGGVTLTWALAFGTLAVLGYATGSPWLLPE